MSADVIEMLTMHEEAISKLYNAYASRFPKHHEFWATLAWEEQDHANKINQLGEELKKGKVVFDPGRFKQAAIESSIKYINQQTERVQKKEDLSLLNALSIAVEIEKTVIDGEFFMAFKGYSPDSRRFIRDLGDAVLEHYRIIKEKLAEHRRIV